MIEAVETKCFDLDKDLDNIKLALQGAEIYIEPSRPAGEKETYTSGDDMDSLSRSPAPETRKASPSPDNISLSSPLKVLDISPEVLKLA